MNSDAASDLTEFPGKTDTVKSKLLEKTSCLEINEDPRVEGERSNGVLEVKDKRSDKVLKVEDESSDSAASKSLDKAEKVKSNGVTVEVLENGESQSDRQTIEVSQEVKIALEDVKNRLKLDMDKALLYLCALFQRESSPMDAGSTATTCSDHEVMSELGGVVRRALREELTALIQDGVLPQNMFCTPVKNHVSQTVRVSPVPVADGIWNSDRPDSSKKRSRKSLPQRLVVGGSVCEPVTILDDSEDEMDRMVSMATGMSEHKNLFTEDSTSASGELTKKDEVLNDTDAMHYNYMVESKTDADQDPVPGYLVELKDSPSPRPSTSLTGSQSPWKQEVFSIGGYQVTRKGGNLDCPYCDYKSPVAARLKRHVTLHTGKGYKCNQCDRSYTEVYKLKEHIQVKHERSVRFDCEYCPKHFTSKGGLKYHLNTSHNADFAFWCDLCCKGFKVKDEFDDHMVIHAGSTPYRCKVCKKEFSYMAHWISHNKECHGSPGNQGDQNDVTETEESIKCDLCTEVFSNLQELNKHALAVHFHENSSQTDMDEMDYTCECGVSFDQYDVLQKHRQNCSFVENSRDDENDEMDHLTEDAEYWKGGVISDVKGNVNESEYRTGHYLRNGSVKLEDREPSIFPKKDVKKSGKQLVYHQCENCEYKTLKKSHLKRHEMTHTGRKHKCTECACSFNEMNKLRYHMKLKHDITLAKEPEVDNKPRVPGSTKVVGMHYCNFCNYKTPKPSHMKRHQMVHIGKDHKCMSCPKSFNEINKLRQHVRSKHEGTAPYVCEDCGKTFTTKGGLQYHVQTKHQQEWKYQCEVCDKKFNQLQHFIGHKNTHTGTRPYVCDVCGRGFSYHSVLLAHHRLCKTKKGNSANSAVLTCEMCQIEFENEDEFNRHDCEKPDEGGEFYVCGCGKEFAEQILYQDHVKNCPDLSSGFVIKRVKDTEDETGHDVDDTSFSNNGATEPVLSQPVFPTMIVEPEAVN